MERDVKLQAAGYKKTAKKLRKQQSLESKENKKHDSSHSDEEKDQDGPLIVERVIDESEISRFVDLGLGRGVDATKPSPWLSKSSFQVREVNFENIIGTEEGGLVNDFETVVESVQQLQTNMSASVPASQQVSVGVDAELSRSYSKTKRSVGTKVLTRTISFRADFDDICILRQKLKRGKGSSYREQKHVPPQRALTLPEGELAKAEMEAALQSHGNDLHKLTFEERLSKWILEHLTSSQLEELAKLEEKGDLAEEANPIDKMVALTESKIVTRKDLRPLCHSFAMATCITHYVCAIELGASKYKVISEEEVQTQIKTTGKVGVNSAASVSLSQQGKSSKKNREKQMMKIGVIRECGKVERGTCEEAVVGVKFQPLSSVVVRCTILKKALEAALQRYIDSQGVAKYGPFYISCHSEQLFFRVDESRILVTEDVNEASEFFIVPCEENGTGRHFSIFHNSESKLKQPDAKRKMRVKPIPRYLCTYVNFRGVSDGPLELKLNAKESKSMLVLHDRRSKHLHPAELTDWINGKEIFYINCKHRSFKKDSYICVAATNTTVAETQIRLTDDEVDTVEGEGEMSTANDSTRKRSTGSGVASAGTGGKVNGYTTCCKPSISAHDDRNTFMLFRLIRVRQKDDWEKYDDPTDTDTEGHGEEKRSQRRETRRDRKNAGGE